MLTNVNATTFHPRVQKQEFSAVVPVVVILWASECLEGGVNDRVWVTSEPVLGQGHRHRQGQGQGQYYG